MEPIRWKYTIPLTDASAIEAFETKYQYQIPRDLKECMRQNNAGMPSADTFDMGENRGMVFGGFLSFNSEDDDTVYTYLSDFEIDNGRGLAMFPFGIDPAGNLFCERQGQIVYLYHENEDQIFCVASSFSEFLKMLR